MKSLGPHHLLREGQDEGLGEITSETKPARLSKAYLIMALETGEC